jgi:hypothetical protein
MTDLEKIQMVGQYIQYAETRKKQYGFLLRNGRATYQETYLRKSKKDAEKKLLSYKSMPIPKLKSDVESKRLDDAEISFQQHVGVYTAFYNEVIKQLTKDDDLMNLKISDPLGIHYYSYEKNRNFWRKMDAPCTFYEIDIAKAYFQSAFKLGYISERLYKKYVDKEGYKQALWE